MPVITKKMSVDLKENGDMANISEKVQEAVGNSGIENGIVTIFAVGSTGAITTTEYEPGLKKDIPGALERIAPANMDYKHHETWHDDNGRSHVQSAIVGTSLAVPFVNGKLALGTWQQIIVMNLDTSPRKREVILQIMGE
jgi:secondary thiamine-phosphate synthase enzyme